MIFDGQGMKFLNSKHKVQYTVLLSIIYSKSEYQVFQLSSEDYPPLDIPVVAIGGLQAQSMRAILHRATTYGMTLEVAIKQNKADEKLVEPADQSKWKVS